MVKEITKYDWQRNYWWNIYPNYRLKFTHYKNIRPVSNQPGKLYATAKTHKFNSLDKITVDNLEFRPILSQVGRYTYNAAKVIANYLKPLCQNLPLSLTLADIHMFQMETNAKVPIRPIFYNWYVDDIYNCCQNKYNVAMDPRY